MANPERKYYTDEAPYWRYYDTPDGHDVMKKIVVAARYGALVGFGASSFDVLMYSHPVGATNVLKRMRWFIAPLAGMGAAFALVSNCVQLVRKKDDVLNYLAGGVAAAPIFGIWQRCKLSCFVAALGLGIVAMVKKAGVDNGWVFFPEPQMQYNSVMGAKYDWTMASDDYPKGFRTGFEKPEPPATPPEDIDCKTRSERAHQCKM